MAILISRDNSDNYMLLHAKFCKESYPAIFLLANSRYLQNFSITVKSDKK